MDMSAKGKVRLVVGVAAILMLVVSVFAFSSFKNTEGGSCRRQIQIPDTVLQSSYIIPIPIPDSLSFAGETVPVKYFDVRESLDRELQVNTFWHSQTVILLKRANRFFPVIEPILKKNNIPDDFKYLAVAESGLSQAISPSKAVGFWQILEGTAKEFGLEVNGEVDERYHIEKSTEAACRYLRKSYQKYGNWTMAAASYNMGTNGISKQMNRQENDSYYDMVLGEETGRYVFRILAIKVIFENPERYGFFLDKKDLYPPYRFTEVQVDTAITSIAQFARQFDSNYKLIKMLNAWLRDNHLVNKAHKTYTIKIPEKDFREGAY